MTATFANILAIPAGAELTALAAAPGVAAGPAVAGQPGDPQSFIAALQALSNPNGDGASGSLLPADLVVAGSGETVPATLMDLVLPKLANAPVSGEAVTKLPDEAVILNGLPGTLLPETGPQSGNILPPVAGPAGPLPTMPDDVTVTTLTASAVTLQQAIPESTQAALTSVTARPMAPDSQLNSDPRTPGTAVINTDESSALTQQMNAVPETELEFASQQQEPVQRAFESITMYSETAATGRSTESMTALTADSGPVGFAQPASQAPLQFNQQMDMSQFQNMRPLQPMADPQAFMEGLGQRLMVMSEAGVQSARLKLYPENLGTLEIKIQVEDNVARVWFTAEHGQAREALETALPRLKELFVQQGMELLQADVGSGQQRQQASDGLSRADSLFPGAVDSEPDDRVAPVVHAQIMMASERSLDIYV